MIIFKAGNFENHVMLIWNFLDAPSGNPVVKPGHLGRYEFQQVALVCDTGSMDVGNPPCRTFTWKKLDEDGDNVIIGSNVLEFTMEEADEGNYTCRCENEYGSSRISDAAELIFLSGTPPSETCKFQRLKLATGPELVGPFQVSLVRYDLLCFVFIFKWILVSNKTMSLNTVQTILRLWFSSIANFHNGRFNFVLTRIITHYSINRKYLYHCWSCGWRLGSSHRCHCHYRHCCEETVRKPVDPSGWIQK